jgi:hypothetical protein
MTNQKAFGGSTKRTFRDSHPSALDFGEVPLNSNKTLWHQFTAVVANSNAAKPFLAGDSSLLPAGLLMLSSFRRRKKRSQRRGQKPSG